jgi:hypothetical protein
MRTNGEARIDEWRKFENQRVMQGRDSWGFGGSSMASLWPAIPYYSKSCREPTTGRPISHPEFRCPQGESVISVSEPPLDTP